MVKLTLYKDVTRTILVRFNASFNAKELASVSLRLMDSRQSRVTVNAVATETPWVWLVEISTSDIKKMAVGELRYQVGYETRHFQGRNSMTSVGAVEWVHHESPRLVHQDAVVVNMLNDQLQLAYEPNYVPKVSHLFHLVAISVENVQDGATVTHDHDAELQIFGFANAANGQVEIPVPFKAESQTNNSFVFRSGLFDDVANTQFTGKLMCIKL